MEPGEHEKKVLSEKKHSFLSKIASRVEDFGSNPSSKGFSYKKSQKVLQSAKKVKKVNPKTQNTSETHFAQKILAAHF